MLERLRPWSLKVAALLRVAFVAIVASRLYAAGFMGLVLGLLFVGCAVGLWFRRPWTWRIALFSDVGFVIYYALTLIESSDVHLFTLVAIAVVIDVGLLSFGQTILVRASPPPPDPPVH